MTRLTQIAKEKGTYAVTVAFADQDGTAIIPATLTWSLMTTAGTAINAKTDVAVSVPAATNDIALTGDDLAIQTGETGTFVKRVLLVEGTYNSTYGTGLAFRDAILFLLENLTGVS